MKTFLLILLLVYSYQPTVKQFQIYEAEEGNVHYLIRGRMAITETKVYLQLDTAYTFSVTKSFDFKGKQFHFLGRDTLYNGELYALYRGVVVIIPGVTDAVTNRQSGQIFIECRTIRSERRVIYKYK